MSRAEPNAGAARPAARKQRGGKKRASRSAEILEAERGQGKIAGTILLVSVACWVAALVLANVNGGGGGPSQSTVGGGLGGIGGAAPANRMKELSAFHAGASDQAIAAALRCVGLLLTAVAAIYIFRFVSARNPDGVARWWIWLAFAGAVCVAGTILVSYLAYSDVATTFVGSGAQTSVRAKQLIDGSGAIDLAKWFDLGSRVLLAAWIALAARDMLRVQMLDRFLGYWGVAAAGAIAVGLSIGDAMFVAWLGSLGILALGHYPGGRPEGWTTLSPTAA